MTYSTLEIERAGQIATVWMNRPELHNAMNEHLIGDLAAAFRELNHDDSVRVIVLAGRGKSFSAGADLDWMRRAAGYSEAQNLEDAGKLAAMLKGIYRSKKPVIARIHGAAMAGGTGLTAVCDIAIATPGAKFALTEVRLGLIPATIGPYVADAIGWRQARRYFLSAERIDAASALRIGLVHEVVDEAQLDARVAEVAAELCRGGPHALSAAKELLGALRDSSPFADELLSDTAHRIAAIRITEEAREGLAAFFDKRPPRWNKD
ncbi:enoyl-CoA hydratase/isomerase family protein [Vogesella sp. GCM10023246]|uniref:Enoyl-CoA hydratase/isomerase family protein n=1 Tax=Vogesella oryzagri TaxID=3160864 RepID=A0ABV1M1S6_9NEIS